MQSLTRSRIKHISIEIFHASVSNCRGIYYLVHWRQLLTPAAICTLQNCKGTSVPSHKIVCKNVLENGSWASSLRHFLVISVIPSKKKGYHMLQEASLYYDYKK
jgi:hypothetical protein